MTSVDRSIRRHLFVGAGIAILLAGSLGAWATGTELSGAVIAHGQVVVESSVKQVQHPSGGVVGELRVRDGDHVKAGDIVLRLDETQTRANLGIVAKALDELAARQARLEAEQDGSETIAFPEELLTREHDPMVARLLAGERKLLELRWEALRGHKAQLQERIRQLGNQIDGLDEQTAAKAREMALIDRELEGAEALWRQQLIPLNRLTALQREAARLSGERGELIAAAAQAEGRIAETELQIIQVDQDLRSEVATELAQVRARIAELGERRVAAEDRLRQIDLRAPQDGIVHQLAVHTRGGVIGPGEVVMLIVPQADGLAVEAKVAPNEIDQLHVGQAVVLRFTAFHQRNTPELAGAITRISPDLMQESMSGSSYYLVRIAMLEAETESLDGLRLVPGMPAEAFVQTERRTVLSYLLKPLTDYATRAFRDG